MKRLLSDENLVSYQIYIRSLSAQLSLFVLKRRAEKDSFEGEDECSTGWSDGQTLEKRRQTISFAMD